MWHLIQPGGDLQGVSNPAQAAEMRRMFSRSSAKEQGEGQGSRAASQSASEVAEAATTLDGLSAGSQAAHEPRAALQPQTAAQQDAGRPGRADHPEHETSASSGTPSSHRPAAPASPSHTAGSPSEQHSERDTVWHSQGARLSEGHPGSLSPTGRRSHTPGRGRPDAGITAAGVPVFSARLDEVLQRQFQYPLHEVRPSTLSPEPYMLPDMLA